ncbi:chemotaxis protein CheB [Rhodohalobacter sp.]|uniref:chemotaxis protein CheB n=1 Tax=Rhodohalobacter sp. TaxID=1974210 RepID=UPI002ACEE3C0|nr:chemotaxis protein CheB [Rhodohalobacter sp.]MDZ7757969.1 chemotaxis protein CheB [Rhodohalobacter sp.]
MMSGEIKKSFKVLVVDSHVLIRQILVSIFKEMDEVQSTVSLDLKSVQEIENEIDRIQPDVLFLGLDADTKDEIQLVESIRKNRPGLPVVIMAPLSKKGASITLKALKLGAVEFITKPDRNSGITLSKRHFRKRVVPLIRVIGELNTNLLSVIQSSDLTIPDVEKVLDQKPQKLSSSVELVVIAGCTGGVKELFQLVSELPTGLPTPVVIVQHMPKIYSRKFASELDRITEMNVREAQNDSPLIPGQIYLAPGGYHTIIKSDGYRKVLGIHKGPRENKNRPSIDVTLRSATQAYGNKILTIFLSGGGVDGIAGAKNVYESGGKIILQNSESALLWNLNQKISEQIPDLDHHPTKDIGSKIIKNLFGKKPARSIRYPVKG